MWKRTLLALTALSLFLAGCQSTKTPTIATAGGTPTASPVASDVLTQYVEAVRAYVACLRAEGIKVSDPDPKGALTFEGDPRTLKTDPKFLNGQKKCAGLHPAIPEELIDKPAMTAAEIDAARRYAKCMRENGAPDFPDPGPDGYFPSRGDPGWNQDAPSAIKAGRICGPIVGEPVSPGPGKG
jgi:hypothetical protein